MERRLHNERHAGPVFCLITILHSDGRLPDEENDRKGIHRSLPIAGGQVFADLHCGALNYINNFFKPDYSVSKLENARGAVREQVHSYLLRSGSFDGEQQDEVGFQIELLVGLQHHLPKHWRENVAHPHLAFFQDLKILDDYEYTLIYLLIEALHKERRDGELVRELENIRISWSCTMGPNEGYLSSLLIFMAAESAKWWAQRPQFKGRIQIPVTLDLIAALDGLASTLSAQIVSFPSRPDIGKISIAALVNACCASVFLLPQIERWIGRLDNSHDTIQDFGRDNRRTHD